MNGNERTVQKMNGIERNVLNGNECDAQPWYYIHMYSGRHKFISLCRGGGED